MGAGEPRKGIDILESNLDERFDQGLTREWGDYESSHSLEANSYRITWDKT